MCSYTWMCICIWMYVSYSHTLISIQMMVSLFWLQTQLDALPSVIAHYLSTVQQTQRAVPYERPQRTRREGLEMQRRTSPPARKRSESPASTKSTPLSTNSPPRVQPMRDINENRPSILGRMDSKREMLATIGGSAKEPDPVTVRMRTGNGTGTAGSSAGSSMDSNV